MASLFDALGLKCEECGDSDGDSTQGYKVVEQRHLCPTCARRLAHAILSDVSTAAVKWPCKGHENKEVEVYCRKCNIAMCHTCALTCHSGHEMDDILKYFADKKETVKKDVEDIAAKQSETDKFLDAINKCSQEVIEHFNALRDKAMNTFDTKDTEREEKRQKDLEKVNTEAEEEIRKIKEKRDSTVAAINARVDKEKANLEKAREAVLSELIEIREVLCRKTLTAKSSAEATKMELDSAESVAKSMLVDCDSKAFHESVAKFHEINLAQLLPPAKDLSDKITSIAKKIRFKRVEGGFSVGYLTGKKSSYEMVKTAMIPAEIKEPFLLGAVSENTVAIRDGSGSGFHVVNVDTGAIDTLLQPDKSRGIWDAAFLPDDGFVYSDYNTGLIHICDKDGECERSLALPDDASRFAFLRVDKRGHLLAANHNAGKICVIDPKTGSHLRTITDIECKPIMNFDILQNGDIIARSGNADIFSIYQSSGATKFKISLADWNPRIDSHVGADNMIYVTYRSGGGDDYKGYVSMISPDGVMRRQNVIEFPTSFLYRYRPRCVNPVPGTIIILNGSVLLVYKDTPGVNELVE